MSSATRVTWSCLVWFPESLLRLVDAEIDALMHERPPPDDVTGHNVNFDYHELPGRLPACDAALRDSAALRLAQYLVTPRTLAYGLITSRSRL